MRQRCTETQLSFGRVHYSQYPVPRWLQACLESNLRMTEKESGLSSVVKNRGFFDLAYGGAGFFFREFTIRYGKIWATGGAIRERKNIFGFKTSAISSNMKCVKCSTYMQFICLLIRDVHVVEHSGRVQFVDGVEQLAHLSQNNAEGTRQTAGCCRHGGWFLCRCHSRTACGRASQCRWIDKNQSRSAGQSHRRSICVAISNGPLHRLWCQIVALIAARRASFQLLIVQCEVFLRMIVRFAIVRSIVVRLARTIGIVFV